MRAASLQFFAEATLVGHLGALSATADRRGSNDVAQLSRASELAATVRRDIDCAADATLDYRNTAARMRRMAASRSMSWSPTGPAP